MEHPACRDVGKVPQSSYRISSLNDESAEVITSRCAITSTSNCFVVPELDEGLPMFIKRPTSLVICRSAHLTFMKKPLM